MWTMISLRCVSGLIAGALVYLAAEPGQQSPAVPLKITVDSIGFSQIDTAGATLKLALTAVPAQNATFRRVSFDSATVNDVPIQIKPLGGPLQLRQGQPIEGFSSLDVQLNFREMTSLDPLRQIVQQQRAKVHAVIRAQLELNLFEKVAIRAGGAWIVTPMDQEVEFTLPGGVFGKAAALAALSAAEPIWVKGQQGQEWRRNRGLLCAQAAAGMAASLVTLETAYQLKSQAGEMTSLHNSSTGFLIDNDIVIAPMEAVAPWSFNSAMAEALADRQLSLAADQTAIVASLLGPPNTPSALLGKDLSVFKALKEKETGVSIRTTHRYPIRFRDSEENAALLKTSGWTDTKPVTISSSPAQQEDWQPAAVCRVLKRDGGPQAVLFLTEARWEGSRYKLKDQLDATAFGSPVWIGDGVTGILQTEDTASDIRVILKRLRAR